MDEDRILAALNRIESWLGSLGDGQAKLEAGQAKLEAGQAKLEAGQAKLEAAQAKLEASVAKLEAAHTRFRVDMMDRMERFENRLTEMREDLVVNLGAVEAVHARVDNTRDEGREVLHLVLKLQRQIVRLSGRVDELENPKSGSPGEE